MNTKEFDQLLERVNQSRKAALKDNTFIEQAELHAKELARLESMNMRPTKKRVKKKKVSAPKRFSNVYEGFAESRDDVFHY